MCSLLQGGVGREKERAGNVLGIFLLPPGLPSSTSILFASVSPCSLFFLQASSKELEGIADEKRCVPGQPRGSNQC